jgi:hypothetical protein
MKNYYTISIPKPCHEDWNQMTPKEKGKFCNACSKTVIDFTKMETFEIQDFINENKNTLICGHFKQTQLDGINLRIPTQILIKPQNFHRIFLLALLITMGISILNCTNVNGNQQKIDSIEIQNDKNNAIIDVTLGLPILNEIDSIPAKTCNNNLGEAIKIESTIEGELDFTTVGDIVIVENPPIEIDSVEVNNPTWCPSPESEFDEEIIMGFISVETPPQFKGTPPNLSIQEKREYFSNQITKIISENFNTSVCLDLKGRQKIYTQFKIDNTGNIIDIKIRAPHPKLEEEAKRVIQLLPQFIPATQRDKPISVVYSLPIVFQTEE